MVDSQKRKSGHEPGDQPAKRVRTQIKTVMKEKKPKSDKASRKKGSKPKTISKPKKLKETSSVALSERRRSGRAHKVSDYKERDDADDEEEMLEGVAEWNYGEDDSDAEESGSGEEGSGQSDEDESAEDEGADEDDDDEGEEEDEGPPAKRTDSKAAPHSKIKARVLAKLNRTRANRGRPEKTEKSGKNDIDMDTDD